MFVRYSCKGGKFVYVSGVTNIRMSAGFVECVNDFGEMKASFSKDCPFEISNSPFPGALSLGEAAERLSLLAFYFRNSMKKTDYISLCSALDGLRQDKN